jgi:hypothetical protein
MDEWYIKFVRKSNSKQPEAKIVALDMTEAFLNKQIYLFLQCMQFGSTVEVI